MRSACFLDTNVVIYAAAGRIDEPRKHRVALDLIRSEPFGLSGQVLAEFYTNAVKKFSRALSSDELDEWIEMLSRYPVVPYRRRSRPPCGRAVPPTRDLLLGRGPDRRRRAA